MKCTRHHLRALRSHHPAGSSTSTLTSAAARAQGGRLCVAAAAGEGAPRGILLGASDSGGMQYIEPPAAVPLNNELGAARAEAAAAEEAVLWRLTGRLADIDFDLQRALDVVRAQLGCLPLVRMLAGLPIGLSPCGAFQPWAEGLRPRRPCSGG